MSKDKYPSIFLKPNWAIVFIILQIFFATSGICQSVICQHVKVCQLASKTASFNIHFQKFEQTSLQLKEYAWGKSTTFQ